MSKPLVLPSLTEMNNISTSTVYEHHLQGMIKNVGKLFISAWQEYKRLTSSFCASEVGCCSRLSVRGAIAAD